MAVASADCWVRNDDFSAFPNVTGLHCAGTQRHRQSSRMMRRVLCFKRFVFSTGCIEEPALRVNDASVNESNICVPAVADREESTIREARVSVDKRWC